MRECRYLLVVPGNQKADDIHCKQRLYTDRSCAAYVPHPKVLIVHDHIEDGTCPHWSFVSSTLL